MYASRQAGADFIFGDFGSDELFGNGGNDCITTADGTGGNDLGNGGAGFDTSTSDPGDTLVGFEQEFVCGD